MPGELVSAATILAGSGAGTWLADKLLGPSANALGEQIRAFAGDRLSKIFNRTESRIKPDAVHALPPGFLVQFVQKASFSEDDDTLTDMWANLLASAATKYVRRHAAYVEILSQLTGFDAEVLSRLVPTDTPYFPQLSAPVNLRIELLSKIARSIKNISKTQQEAHEELNRLFRTRLDWPGEITSGRVYFEGEGGNHPLTGGNPDQFASYDNLVRLGLIQRFDVSNSLSQYDVAVEGVLVTMLGIGFTQTCRGLAQ
jgi:hypothetical protein